MTIYSEFPVNQWVEVTEISLFLDGKVVDENKTESALKLYEQRYGERICNYLRLLRLSVGQKQGSLNNLRPPFGAPYLDSMRGYKYELDNLSLLFENNRKGMVTISVEKKKKGLLGLPSYDVAKLAELKYEKVRR